MCNSAWLHHATSSIMQEKEEVAACRNGFWLHSTLFFGLDALWLEKGGRRCRHDVRLKLYGGSDGRLGNQAFVSIRLDGLGPLVGDVCVVLCLKEWNVDM